MSRDLGVIGTIFSIIEKDLIEVIKNKLNQMPDSVLQEHKDKMQKVTREALERPQPIGQLGTTKEYRRTYFDPTIELNEDIRDHNNQIIHPMGKRVNPLHFVKPTKHLLFIDARDRAQVEWVTKFKKAHIVLTGGAPLKLEEKLQRQIYFDQKGILTKKFDIHNVPAVVSVVGEKLLIEEVPISKEDNHD